MKHVTSNKDTWNKVLPNFFILLLCFVRSKQAYVGETKIITSLEKAETF